MRNATLTAAYRRGRALGVDGAVRMGDARRRVDEASEDVDRVIALAAGDRRALAALYDRHAPGMLGLGLRILRDRGEAEELLHDVFLEAWKRAGDYDPSRGSVRTWLMLRMRSRCLDYAKSAARSRTRPAGATLEAIAGSAEPPGLGESDRSRIRGAMAELPAEQRTILELGYFAGLSCSEIAGELAIPIGTVKSRLHAALTKLRAVFTPEARP
jgi:RNA polymerase sigma-70 factor (ECF subfamily)